MPLGLELAAAWVFQLPCQEIADQIEAEIDFLTTRMRNIPERHHSLRAVFDYSWEKLSPKEQEVMQNLSVFRGGFDHLATKAVASASLQILSSLADKSLLSNDENGRFGIHELLRQILADKLNQDGSAEQETCSRHCHYFLAYISDLKDKITGGETSTTMAILVQEIDNVRLAIRWGINHHPHLFDLSLDWTLSNLFELKGWFLEAKITYEMIINKLLPACNKKLANDNPTAPQQCIHAAQYQRRLGWFLVRLGRYREAEEQVNQALRLIEPFDSLEAKDVRGDGIYTLSSIETVQGDLLGARTLCQKAQALFKEINSKWLYAHTHYYLAILSLQTGDFNEVKKLLEMSVQLFNDMGATDWESLADQQLGKLATLQGELSLAESHFGKALAGFLEMDHQTHLTYLWREMGEAARLKGDLESAKLYCQKTIDAAHEINMPDAPTLSFWTLGNVAVDEGDYDLALIYFNKFEIDDNHKREDPGGPGWAWLGLENHVEAETCFKSSLQFMLNRGARPIGLDGIVGIAHIRAHAGQLEDALALLALVRHHRSSAYASLLNLDKLWGELVAKLPPKLASEANASGHEMDLWQTAESLLAEAEESV